MHPNINGSAPVKFVFANPMPRFVDYRAALNGVQSLAGFKLPDRSHAGIPHYILDNTDTNETRFIIEIHVLVLSSLSLGG